MSTSIFSPMLHYIEQDYSRPSVKLFKLKSLQILLYHSYNYLNNKENNYNTNTLKCESCLIFMCFCLSMHKNIHKMSVLLWSTTNNCVLPLASKNISTLCLRKRLLWYYMDTVKLQCRYIYLWQGQCILCVEITTYY